MRAAFDVQPDWTRSALVRIAEELYAEAETFGKFIDLDTYRFDGASASPASGLDEKQLDDDKPNGTDTSDDPVHAIRAYLAGRSLVLPALLDALEETARPRFRPAVPYRFGLGTRPAGAPLAGWTDPVTQPSAVVSSMFSTWIAVASSEEFQQAEFNRTLRSMLWVLAHSGVTAAFDYLLALCLHGHVSSTLAAGRAGAFLMTGLSQVQSHDELLGRLYGGAVPTEDKDWLVPYPIEEWFEPASPTADTSAAVGSMLECLLQVLDEVRAAATIDDWLGRLGGLRAGLEMFHWLVKYAVPQPSLALQSVISQFEEISADIPVLLSDLSLGALEPGIEYQARLAAPYPDRFAGERQLIPQHAMCRPAPPGWSAPSRTAALPFLLHFLEASEEIQYLPSIPVSRSDPAYPEQLDQRRKEVHDEIAAIAEGLSEDQDSYLPRMRAFRLLARYPCCDVAHWQVGQSYYQAGEYDAAEDALARAIIVRPYERTLWHSLALCFEGQNRTDAASIAHSMADLLARGSEPADKPPED
jgi:hypothetical protein